MDNRHYLVVDSDHQPLARALLESPMDADLWVIRVLDERVDTVLSHEAVELVGMDDGAPSLVCRIVGRRDDRLKLERVRSLGADARQKLRIPTQFKSFIYPVTGAWTGRLPIISRDLSCGGVGFYCNEALENGEGFEIVIPVTRQPLLLRAEILCQRMSSTRLPLYAAKFVDMIPNEEKMVQEAVFSLQIENRARSAFP